jgi:hypothetical protein
VSKVIQQLGKTAVCGEDADRNGTVGPSDISKTIAKIFGDA